MSVHTNRDLYQLVAGFESSRSLEDYLSALWQIAERCRTAPAIPAPVFGELLASAFAAEPRTYDPSPCVDGEGYSRFEATIASQIVDLHEMALNGQLEDKYRYFGINAPRGARWYNFDPCTYLECAVAGTFGGWCEGDDTGRDYVPGLVAVFDNAGGMTAVDPRTIHDPIGSLAPITWAQFADFLFAGQCYE